MKEGEKRRNWAVSILEQLENVIQPNPGIVFRDIRISLLLAKTRREHIFVAKQYVKRGRKPLVFSEIHFTILLFVRAHSESDPHAPT